MAKRKIIVLESNENLNKNIVLCPNCGDKVFYGKLDKYSHHYACKDCIKDLKNKIDKLRIKDYYRYKNDAHLYIISDYAYEKLRKKHLKKMRDLGKKSQDREKGEKKWFL